MWNGRTVSVVLGTYAERDSIREVIAFPKNNKGVDLMSASPAEVDFKQLRELYITSAAQAAGSTALLVVYAIPGRDCGSHSGGGGLLAAGKTSARTLVGESGIAVRLSFLPLTNTRGR